MIGADTIEVVHTHRDAGILTLTLDSPSNRNALGESLVAQLLDGLRSAREDDAVRAVVLTHTGGTFCAGADLTEALSRGQSIEAASLAGAESMIETMRTMLELPKPVIAKVNGHVRAGGFGLIGACDVALGGPDCTFALSESRLGLAPAVVSLVLLPKMTARGAGRYFVTGEAFGAQTAVELGILTESGDSVVALDDLLETVLTGVRKASPQGLATSKRLTTNAILADFDRDAGRRAAESSALFCSDEARDGMTAFLSKAKPAWDMT